MIRQICTIDMPYINDDIPYMYEDKPYMYEDKPYMHDDKPHMYDDMTYIKDDMTDINDDMTDMYEYHIHVWYHVAWGGDEDCFNFVHTDGGCDSIASHGWCKTVFGNLRKQQVLTCYLQRRPVLSNTLFKHFIQTL